MLTINQMAKTKEDQVKEWIKKHDICGETPWWDRGNCYYNLTAKQIVSIAQYLKKNNPCNPPESV